MSYRLPPLNSLRAFDAAARHLSFKLAANELCVTPGAVSQQVKALEQTIGVTLFKRLPNRLVLSTQGESYQSATGKAFGIISEATEELAPALQGRSLRLGVSADLTDTNETGAVLRKLRSEGIRLEKHADMATLQAGKIDGLVRTYLARHAGLVLEHFQMQGTSERITLAVQPGLAGCAQHRQVISALRGALQSGH